MQKRRFFGQNRINKRAFTLMEMVVVLALLAILSVMVASFSGSMGRVAGNQEQQVAFLEGCTMARQDLDDWLCSVDATGGSIALSEFTFTEGALAYGGTAIGTYRGVGSITFTRSEDGKMLRCLCSTEDQTYSFVLAPRCAEVVA